MKSVKAADPKSTQLGRYQLVERLAAGGMAEIFMAKTQGAHGFEKTLVVKRLLSHLANDDRFVEMFIDEAKVMVQLDHPKIVQVLDFGEVDGQYFIAMEYIDGLDLLAVLRRCAMRNCRPSVEIACHIVAEVLDALDYAHELTDGGGRPLGIVHRDISPSNVFVSAMGEVKLGDFGIATAGDTRGHVEPGTLRGKFGYLAPEHVTGANVDRRSDLFSAGVVLAELLTVRRLFVGNSDLEVLLQVRDARLDRLHERMDRVPLELRPVLASALARDPETRYQDAASFRDALHRYLFETRRMVHRTDVRRFLQQLMSDVGPLPGDPEMPDVVISPPVEKSEAGQIEIGQLSPAYEIADAGPVEDDLTPVISLVDVGDKGLQRIPSVVGRKRKVVIGPPPKPEPVPNEALETRDAPVLKTNELLAVAPQKRSPSSSSFMDVETYHKVHGATLPPQNAIPERKSPSESEMKEMLSQRLMSRSEWSSTARPEMSGLLQNESLFSVLFKLAVQEATGLLVIRAHNALKEIYVVDGDPSYVISDRAEELFGQYLVERGVISEGELSMALAILPQFGGKIGDALVALKLLTAVQVMRHLTKQVRQKLFDAFEWNTGGFAFYDGKECEYESAPLGLDAFEILGAGSKALGREALETRIEAYLDAKPRAVNDTAVPPEVFRLGGKPRAIFEKLDGRLTVREHLQRYDDEQERESFARIAYLLLETGMARTRSLHPTDPWRAQER